MDVYICLSNLRDYRSSDARINFRYVEFFVHMVIFIKILTTYFWRTAVIYPCCLHFLYHLFGNP